MHTDTEILPYGEYSPSGASRAVLELATLPPDGRRLYGVNDFMLEGFDSLVEIAKLLGSDDGKSMLEKLSMLDEGSLPSAVSMEWIHGALSSDSGEDIARWIKQMRTPYRMRVLNRFLGTAAYDRLVSAVRADARVVLESLRVLVSVLRLWVVALGDASEALNDDQRRDAQIEAKFGPLLFGSVLMVEAWLDFSLEDETGISIPDQDVVKSAAEGSLEQKLAEMRDLVRGRADGSLQELGQILSRKLIGARDALKHSADGVSQAANSLVEFIDRFARTAFSESEVLEWLACGGLTGEEWHYEREGKLLPTKQAQIMCLVYAGETLDDDPDQLSFRKVAGYALLNARKKLQKLKHADAGLPSEREEIESLLTSLESGVVVMVYAGWTLSDPQRVEMLREKFS